MSSVSDQNLVPPPFLSRKLHSLAGVFFSFFLAYHLFVNSQAALFFGDDGKDFIHSVNKIHAIPYLPLVEIFLLATPILIHMVLGIRYLRGTRYNSWSGGDGTRSSLPFFRNRAFTWQRITALFLIFLLAFHIGHMRFVKRPEVIWHEGNTLYQVQVEKDAGYETLGPRLDIDFTQMEGQTYARAKDFGTAMLLVVREAFKSPVLMALYTLFVLFATFHGFNGLWTALISWGVIMNPRAQAICYRIAQALVCLVSFLGLIAIFGTYWINLKA